MFSKIAGKVLPYLQAQEQAMVDFLKELVRAESPSRQPATQQRVMQLLEEQFRGLGYYTLRVPGHHTGGYLYARPGIRQRKQSLQLLLGHCDTVWKVGTLEDMPVKEGPEKLRGPGVFDMKAGLTQLIYALKTIRELELEPLVRPVVLINSDEEIGSFESTPSIRRLARIAERAFVLEPPLGIEGKLKTTRKGVGRFTITIKGQAAHAGLDPGRGASAIVELSHQVQRLFAMNDPSRGLTINVGLIEGGISANVVAPESKAIVDVRVQNHEDADRITREILNLQPVLPNVKLQLEGRIGRPPLEATTRNRQLWEVARRAATSLDLELEEAMAGGGSDGNTTSLFTATLDGLGTPGDGAHADHEFIFTEKLAERTALLTLLIMAPPLPKGETSNS